MQHIKSDRSAAVAAVFVAWIAASAHLQAAPSTLPTDGWGNHRVGHRSVHLQLTGTLGEPRPLDVMLWYPADRDDYRHTPLAVYRPRLYGVPLVPARWDPLSWQIEAEAAHEGAAIDAAGPAFPVLILSHASGGEPLGYANLVERIASRGYIVVAPFHNGDSRDDARVEFVDARAGTPVLACLDGLPVPCTDSVAKSVADRALDVKAIVANLAAIFDGRADVDRIGFIGHSRGSISALAAAGGSTVWNVAPEPRIKAIMTMAIGQRTVTFNQNLANITVPALLVGGTLDQNTPLPIVRDAFGAIRSARKAFLAVKGAHHGVYGPGYCAQIQVAGAIASSNPRALLELQTLMTLLLSPVSGTTLDWCFYETFTQPVDVRQIVASITGYQVAPDDVPRALDSETVMHMMLDLAVPFFDDTLDVHRSLGDDDGTSVRLAHYLNEHFRDAYAEHIDELVVFPAFPPERSR